jgi:hypothetical protein
MGILHRFMIMILLLTQIFSNVVASDAPALSDAPPGYSDGSENAPTPGAPQPGVMPEPGAPEPAAPIVPTPNVPKPAAPIAPGKPAPPMPPAMPVAPVLPKIPVSPIGVPTMMPGAPGLPAPTMVPAAAPMVSKSASSQTQVVDVHVDDDSNGLDTINVDSSGNWLEKRIWYQKAEQLFEVIRMNLQKAADLRMKFVNEVNHVGHQIDEFYETISFAKGEIDAMLEAVLQAVENQEQVRGGDLSSSERSLKAKVQDDQKQFQSLSSDLKLIDDLDEQCDKTMMKAFKEIDACRGLETRSWNNFKEIGLELDDKKARVLYYEMENCHKNIEQKMTYLSQNLLPYLQNQLVTKVTDTMTQIKTASQALETKGVGLKTVLAKDEQGDLLILKEREKMQEDAAKSSAKPKAKPVNSGFSFATILEFVMPVLCKIQEWFSVILCCIQCVLCKIQEMICRLFGY